MTIINSQVPYCVCACVCLCAHVCVCMCLCVCVHVMNEINHRVSDQCKNVTKTCSTQMDSSPLGNSCCITVRVFHLREVEVIHKAQKSLAALGHIRLSMLSIQLLTQPLTEQVPIGEPSETRHLFNIL